MTRTGNLDYEISHYLQQNNQTAVIFM